MEGEKRKENGQRGRGSKWGERKGEGERRNGLGNGKEGGKGGGRGRKWEGAKKGNGEVMSRLDNNPVFLSVYGLNLLDTSVFAFMFIFFFFFIFRTGTL